jgi:hypothetical protein
MVRKIERFGRNLPRFTGTTTDTLATTAVNPRVKDELKSGQFFTQNIMNEKHNEYFIPIPKYFPIQ